MKVCVTGANGFLATNLIEQLLDDGYVVHGLIRTLGKLRVRGHQHFNLFIGDLDDPAALERAMQGCDYVIHAAALTRQDLHTYQPYYRVNVSGTQHVVDAAVKCSIKRLVYVSTANTIGHGVMNTGQENRPITSPFHDSFYALSKLHAERIVIASQERMETVIVNPTFMIGAYDNKSGHKNIMLTGLQRVVLCAPGGKNFVHVKDVAKGTIAAMEKGTNGERYLLAGENLSYADFFNRMSSITRHKPFVITIPRWMLLIAGVAGNLLRSMRMNTVFSGTNMRMLCTHNYYSNCKARKNLGLTFLPVEYAIKDALYDVQNCKEASGNRLNKQEKPGN